jgi:hypothetical protein
MPWIELALHLLFSIIGTLFISLTGFLLVLLFSRVLRVKAEREHAVVLENKGNCRSIYYLEVKSPEPSLHFTLLFNKLPLAAVYLPTESDDLVESPPTKNPPSQTEQPGNIPASTTPSGVDAAAKAGQSVSSVAGKSASVLEQIGNFLPGSMGSKLKQQASSSRAVQAASLRTSRAPQTLSRQVSGFQGKSGGKQSAGDGKKVSSSRQLKVGASEESCFVQTPLIEPGQSLNLLLRVGTRRRHYPPGSFPYTIEALPVTADFPDVAAMPSIKNGTVHFNPVGAWRYFLPAFSTVTLILMTLTALVFLYRFIWL